MGDRMNIKRTINWMFILALALFLASAGFVAWVIVRLMMYLKII